MKEKLLYIVTWIGGLLLLPYLLSCIINGTKTTLLNRPYNVEYCLPVYLSMQIPKEYEFEMIKAQAVIARTNVYNLEKDEDLLTIFPEIKKDVDNYKILKKIWNTSYTRAVAETENVVLAYEGDIKMVPFHECSAGRTRDGEEVFHDTAYAYLKSVDSSIDKESPDYLCSTYISAEDFGENIEIHERDQAGYVMSLKTGEKLLEGEAFRRGFGLSSSNFSFEKTENQYKVICKGKGHGLGLSQYGGNRFAKNGKTWREILEIYFPEMSCQLF